MRFLALLVLVVVSASCHAKAQVRPKLAYCGGTVTFRTEPFDRDILEKASLRDDCRSHEIPLSIKTSTGTSHLALEMWSASDFKSGASPFLPVDQDGNFIFDSDSFDEATRYEGSYRPFEKYANQGNYYATVYTNKTKNGTLVVNTINFLGGQGDLTKVAKIITFFKQDSYSISYLGDPISTADVDALKAQLAVEQLFLSMEIEW